VPAGEVQVTPLGQDDLLPSLSGGEVDAISTWIPRATLAQAALGPTAVVLDEPGLYTATWNLVGERTAVATDPDRFERFLRAVVRANRFLAEHPGEAQAITARHAGLDLDQVRERWDDHAFGAVLDRALVLHLEDQARWLLERSAPGTPVPDVRRHLAADPLRAARPGAVQLPWTEE
jgi:NitT/TauT family transport system substrate-binding protein